MLCSLVAGSYDTLPHKRGLEVYASQRNILKALLLVNAGDTCQDACNPIGLCNCAEERARNGNDLEEHSKAQRKAERKAKKKATASKDGAVKTKARAGALTAASAHCLVHMR